MRWTLNVTNAEEPGVRHLSGDHMMVSIPGTFHPTRLAGFPSKFDAVIFSVPMPELNPAQIDAIDSVLRNVR